MSQMNIQILHQEYVLTCPDGQEAQLQEAVERVDQQFQKMRDTSKLRSRERVGVLLAVNLAYENLELRQQLQTLQQQLAELQGNCALVMNDVDTQRLQAFEEQAQYDHIQAQQLMLRLDTVLAPPHGSDVPDTAKHISPTATEVAEANPDAMVSLSAALVTEPEEARADLASSPVFDNKLAMELTHQASESL